MIIRQQIRFAVFGSVVLHLLFAFGITTMLAYKRSLPPGNDDFNNALDLGSGYNFSSFSDFTYASREMGEPVHAGTSIGGSVWWKWNAQENCMVELNVESCDELEELYKQKRNAVANASTEETYINAEMEWETVGYCIRNTTDCSIPE